MSIRWRPSAYHGPRVVGTCAKEKPARQSAQNTSSFVLKPLKTGVDKICEHDCWQPWNSIPLSNQPNFDLMERKETRNTRSVISPSHSSLDCLLLLGFWGSLDGLVSPGSFQSSHHRPRRLRFSPWSCAEWLLLQPRGIRGMCGRHGYCFSRLCSLLRWHYQDLCLFPNMITHKIDRKQWDYSHCMYLHWFFLAYKLQVKEKRAYSMYVPNRT